MTDDFSHLDELVEREAAPSRSRRSTPPPEPKPEPERFVAGATQPEWTRAFMGLVERLVDRLVRVEDGLIDVRDQLESMERTFARQIDNVQGDVVGALQPMLQRRHDDATAMQQLLTGVADDLQALRTDFDKRFADRPPDLAGAVTALAETPHQPTRHPATDFATPTFEPDLPMVEAPPVVEEVAEVEDVEEDAEDRAVTASVFHLPPDYFEERGSVPHRVEPRHRPPEGDGEDGRHEVREQRAQH